MRQRGRQSQASLAVVPVMPHQRLPAPDRLNAEQAEIWRGIVAGLPAEWFAADNAALLEAYCNSVWEIRRIDEALRSLTPSCEEYPALMRARVALMQQMRTFATSMRLTNQARQEAKTAGVHARRAAQATTKPWEFQG